ncbi:MAG TPA: hypothetical protein VF843_12065 [Streptosporangiaceae bacterium]
MITTTARPAGPRPEFGLSWVVRPGGEQARPALEVYVAGTLADVLVATPLSPAALGGGGRLAGRGRTARVMAWGRLAAGSPPVVEFRPFIGRPRLALVTKVSPWFWVAAEPGRFATVTVRHDGHAQRRRLRRIRP